MEKYMLEITMEARIDADRRHCYIKRSFPADEGPLDISRYGYPFDRKDWKIEIGKMKIDGNIRGLGLAFDGEVLYVPLNSFKTVRRDYEFMEARASIKHFEIIHTTFYLFVE